MLDNAGYLAILALGFGFVVFWHELGHFLAAKWAGVKVEQFAVGFMQAVVSWRKGIGFRFGSTQKEYRRRIYQHLGKVEAEGESPDAPTDYEMAKAAQAMGLGDTEYRLNWLPLGGYVKMLGQDDLRPNSEAEDPRAYNRQPIGKRMVIVSAGVVMNIILAAAGFVALFMWGFHVPPAKVGSVQAGSPAQVAKADRPEDNGFRVGDDVLEVDGKPTHNDNTKLALNSALSAGGEEIPVRVRRDGRELTLRVTPVKDGGMVVMGIGPHVTLEGPKWSKDEPKDAEEPPEALLPQLFPADATMVKAGDVITAVNGQPVKPEDYAAFDRQVQRGEKVKLTIRDKDGKDRSEEFTPSFATPFGSKAVFNLLGLVPRLQVESIDPKKSPARGRLQPGDVMTAVASGDGAKVTTFPSYNAFRTTLEDAAKADLPVTVTVLRGGKSVADGGTIVTEKDMMPIKVARDKYGLYLGVGLDEAEAVVADALPDSPAALAKVPAKSKVVSIDGRQVKTWRDVHLRLREAVAGKEQGTSVKLAYQTEGGEPKEAEVKLDARDVTAINQVQYAAGLALRPTEGVRKAAGIGDAVKLGVVETRDFILQFYVTLKRMATRDVDATNLMGPVGIFQAGTHFASKGGDWLLWFLAMISANLAVVNFLPIPVVDGGLFAFLLAEKIKGKPISQRTQAIAQYVGLALLLSIFLFVTYQDIANFQFRMR